jgi:hypothetical protein
MQISMVFFFIQQALKLNLKTYEKVNLLSFQIYHYFFFRNQKLEINF